MPAIQDLTYGEDTEPCAVLESTAYSDPIAEMQESILVTARAVQQLTTHLGRLEHKLAKLDEDLGYLIEEPSDLVRRALASEELDSELDAIWDRLDFDVRAVEALRNNL